MTKFIQNYPHDVAEEMQTSYRGIKEFIKRIHIHSWEYKNPATGNTVIGAAIDIAPDKTRLQAAYSWISTHISNLKGMLIHAYNSTEFTASTCFNSMQQFMTEHPQAALFIGAQATILMILITKAAFTAKIERTTSQDDHLVSFDFDDRAYNEDDFEYSYS